MRSILDTLKISISKQQLATLPAAGYTKKITVIEKAEDVPAAIESLRREKIIGFDTETRPSFKKGVSYKVSLIQLCGKNECFLFRINKCGFRDEIVELFEDPVKIKVGLSLHDDFTNLSKLRKFNPKGFVDLQTYVKQSGIIDNSLSRIYAIVFGQRISKNQRLSNWEAPTLKDHQQAYAALDAYACIQIYNAIGNRIFKPRESQYILPDTPEETAETPDNTQQQQ